MDERRPIRNRSRLLLIDSIDRPGKAQFVAVGIAYMKVPFAPSGVFRRRFGTEARVDKHLVVSIDVVDVKDHTPPIAMGIVRIVDEIEKT